MAAAAADHRDVVEMRRAVFELDAALEFFEHLVRHFAVHAADVFALDLRARMHQRVGEIAVGRQQQEARRVDVEPADRDPARAFQERQLLEHRRAAFRIVARRDDAFGLVVDEHLRVFGVVADDDEALAVHLDAIAGAHARSDRRDDGIDLHLAGFDALFEQAPGAEPRVGEDLVQALIERRRVAGCGTFEREDGAGRRWSCSVFRGVVAHIGFGRCVDGVIGGGLVLCERLVVRFVPAISPVSSASVAGIAPSFVANANCGSMSSMSRISLNGGIWSSDFRLK